LKRPIFKRKKGFVNLNLGLIYHSKALPQPPSRDTVPLSYLFRLSAKRVSTLADTVREEEKVLNFQYNSPNTVVV
jgi:hypothetical protein